MTEQVVAKTTILGHYTDETPTTQEYLVLGFSPSSVPLQQRWRNNGLSADFLADYLTTFFPGDEDDPEALDRQAEIHSAVNYIANELLENAMKFNDEASHSPISIQLQLHSDRIRFLVTNSIKPAAVEPFQALIQELISADPKELLIAQIERNAADETSQASGLGLLTMINDYDAKIGWKFLQLEPPPETVMVTTAVELTL